MKTHEPDLTHLDAVSQQPVGDEVENVMTDQDSLQTSLRAHMRQVIVWFRENPKVALGLGIITFFVLVAIFGPILNRTDPNAFDQYAQIQPPSTTHWFGTTQTGQDVFAQVVVGSRLSLLLGFGAGLLATILSITIGLIAGYFGGIIDDILSLFINIFLVLPALPLVIVLASYSTVKGPLPVVIVILITGWAWGARVLRAQTMSLRQRDFVQNSCAMGESWIRIIFAEILPNEIAIVASSFIGTVIYAILAQVGLEFLGLGDVTAVSWGNMFFWAQSDNALGQGAWWWFLAPGLCLALLGMGLSLVNFGIDDLANPRLRQQRISRKGVSR